MTFSISFTYIKLGRRSLVSIKLLGINLTTICFLDFTWMQQTFARSGVPRSWRRSCGTPDEEQGSGVQSRRDSGHGVSSTTHRGRPGAPDATTSSSTQYTAGTGVFSALAFPTQSGRTLSSSRPVTGAPALPYVLYRERERERESERVRERERERESVCVCVCVWERERERGTETETEKEGKRERENRVGGYSRLSDLYTATGSREGTGYSTSIV